MEPDSLCLVTCRENLEPVVARELEALGLEVNRLGRRVVFFNSDLAGVYRANMGLHSGLNVLVPLRTFNARNYDMLYYQSRKTNWHKFFSVENTLRIDVNGGSSNLNHTEYVIHRVKDGIVDTFRKLTDGQRPSISKDAPGIHIVVHLDGPRVTLLLDTSGLPLFKRGYRTTHGGAPIKEDLAAGILQSSGWDFKQSLLDPCCGTGTLLFEAWFLATQTAPNLNRAFAFENLFTYDPELHEQEKAFLQKRIRAMDPEFKLMGRDIDPEVIELAKEIAETHFPSVPLDFAEADCSESLAEQRDAFLITNPPYGKRMESDETVQKIHQCLGQAVESTYPQAAVFTAALEAVKALPKSPEKPLTLYNGKLEGKLFRYQPGT